jgi:hypothetical protein
MNLVQENIIKFIDSVISENYSTAHKYLGTIIEEKLKGKIKKGFEQPAFGGSKEEKKKAKKSAFGGKFPKAKDKKKVKVNESVESETLYLRSVFDSDLYSKMKELFRKCCHGGDSKNKYMEIAYTLGKVDMEYWGPLLDEIEDCINSSKDQSDKAYLTAILNKIKDAGTQLYQDQEEFEKNNPRHNPEGFDEYI